jgi:hypothetical protein
VIQRWKSGALRPDIDNARRLADALGRPLLEVLVAAEIVTEDEVHLCTNEADPSTLTNEQLLVEIGRRMSGGGRGELTREEMAAYPTRFEPVGESPNAGGGKGSAGHRGGQIVHRESGSHVCVCRIPD